MLGLHLLRVMGLAPPSGPALSAMECDTHGTFRCWANSVCHICKTNCSRLGACPQTDAAAAARNQKNLFLPVRRTCP